MRKSVYSFLRENALALSEIKFIMEEVLGTPFYSSVSEKVEDLTEKERKRLQKIIEGYKKGAPLEYILKKACFFGEKFEVNSSVLIPRPSTEVLVEEVLRYIPSNLKLNILDIGTGSANISIILAKKRPRAKIFAGELSLEALEVARRNKAFHRVKNVYLVGGDLFLPFKPLSFEVIISNPPYVESSYWKAHTSLKVEPLLAIDGKEDGLFFIRKILQASGEYLRKGGLLFLEIGYNQLKRVLSLRKDKSLKFLGSFQDYQGIERGVIFRKETQN